MTPHPVLRAAILAAPLLMAAPAVAQGIPEPLRGAWYAGTCADPATMLVVTARSAVRVDAEAPARLLRFRAVSQRGEWTLGTATGAEADRLLLRLAPEGLETAEPDAKTRDDQLPGTITPSVWRRCPATPPAVAALHSEGVAFLGALEHLEAACIGGPPAGCAAAIVAQGDVSGDGKLSPAEVGRMVRGIAWVAAAREQAPPDVLIGVVGASTIGGILAGRLVMESMDYDGDGRLSAAEIAQDSASFAANTGTAAGQPLQLEGLTEGAGMLRGLIDGLMGR